MNKLDTPPADSEPDAPAFSAVSLLLHSARSHDELVVSATRALSEMLDAEGSTLVLRDPAKGDLVFYAVVGAKSEELQSFRLAEGEGVTGHCIATASPAVVNDVRREPFFSPRADATSGFHTRSVLCVPLVLEGTCIGACTVVNSRRFGGFNERDLALCELVAGHVAVAIRNVQLSRALAENARLAALGQAVAGAAHCMKNLVLVLKGSVYILKAESAKEGGDAPRQGVAMLEENVGRLARVIDDMLTYAKDGQPQRLRADLGELVSSAAASMEPAARSKSVELLTEVEANLGPVELDGGGIHRCVLNLLSNAIDATRGPGASVRLAARSAGAREVCIEVSDDGCGMDDQTLAALFQPFFTTKGTDGTGLGLAVTSRIVREHGGRVEVESEKGRGSSFRLFLPRVSSGGAPSLS